MAKQSSSALHRWTHMIARCYDEQHKAYKNYGGRGIIVCERWHDWRNFVADMGQPPPGTQLDRRDNELGYSPENCRWVTRAVNNRNRRNNRHVTIEGETKVVTDWCVHFGISHQTVCGRVAKGEDHVSALTRPVVKGQRSDNRFIAAFGRQQTLSAWAHEYGVDRKVIAYRIKQGWTPENAISVSPANNGFDHGLRVDGRRSRGGYGTKAH